MGADYWSFLAIVNAIFLALTVLANIALRKERDSLLAENRALKERG